MALVGTSGLISCGSGRSSSGGSTILAAAATPTFSPAAGSYASAQTVAISDATSGTIIYYTTDGTTPTPSSSVYSSPIPVNATETLNAIAAASGYTNSAVATDRLHHHDNSHADLLPGGRTLH